MKEKKNDVSWLNVFVFSILFIVLICGVFFMYNERVEKLDFTCNEIQNSFSNYNECIKFIE